jgi:hypothetical protein
VRSAVLTAQRAGTWVRTASPDVKARVHLPRWAAPLLVSTRRAAVLEGSPHPSTETALDTSPSRCHKLAAGHDAGYVGLGDRA